MRSQLTILLFTFLFTSAFSQNIYVFDKEGKPVENVIVVGDQFTTHTTTTGALNFFPDGGISMLTFIHPNYKRTTLTWDQLALLDFRVILEEKNRQLAEVVIRPMKRAQSMSDVSQKIELLTPADVQLYQPQTTADMLAGSGEVFIQKSQMGGGSPMIRGFSANRILLVVDGVRINNAIYRSGNLHNVISLDAASLEQTEIILGPGSVIYGSDALGGVIHFYTLKPRLGSSTANNPANVMARYSSANFEKTAHVNYNSGGEKWASLTSLTSSFFDNLMMGNRGNEAYVRNHYVITENGNDATIENPNPNKQVYSAYSQMNAIQKFRYRPGDKADFEYAFHFSNSSDIPRYDRLLEYQGIQLKYAEWYYGPQRWMMHSFKAELNPESQIMDQLIVVAAYQDFTESRHDRRFGRTALNSRIDNVDIFSVNIDADKYFTPTQSIYYGIEGVFNKLHSTGFQTDILSREEKEIASRYPDGAEWWSMAAYVMYNQLISSRTSLKAGARYSFSGMNGTFDNRFYNFPFNGFSNIHGSPTINFGMVLTPTDHLRVNINTGTGFRAPNIDDAAKVFDSEPGSVIVPNPDLSPEYASTFETGIKWNPASNFAIDFTLFYTRLFNAMVRRNGQLNGQDSILYDGLMSRVLTITNASWANIGGVSSQVCYSPYSFLTFKGGINWQTGIDSDNLPVRHVAPLFSNFHIELKKQRFLVDFYLLMNGKMSHEKLALDEREKTHMYATDINGNSYSPAWYTINLKGKYTLSDKIDLGAGVENLLNVRYRPYSSGIVAPGFNLILSMNVRL